MCSRWRGFALALKHMNGPTRWWKSLMICESVFWHNIRAWQTGSQNCRIKIPPHFTRYEKESQLNAKIINWCRIFVTSRLQNDLYTNISRRLLLHMTNVIYCVCMSITSAKEIIYSTLFTKYGRQLNRINTATKRHTRAYTYQTHKRWQMLSKKTSIFIYTERNNVFISVCPFVC